MSSDGAKMKIRAWIRENPATLQVGETLAAAVQVMAERRIGAILVMDGDHLVGVFTERDLVRLFSHDPSRALSRPMSEFMTPNPICAGIEEDHDEVYAKMQAHSIRHIPILDGERLVGIVSIRDLTHYYQNRLETEFIDARRRIDELERLAQLRSDEKLRALVDEVNLYKELSVTDPLTGLYNKRYFMARLIEETARSLRYGEKLSLIFCDVDHFKRVNDNFGHAAGDLVLQQVARILAGGMDRFNIVSRLRKSDIVARYGGEEFVVILPETNGEGASRAAEHVREAVAAYRFRLNGDDGHVTMSFGVAEHDASIKSAEELIRRADLALYRAKEAGRNRVATWEAGRA